MTHRREDYEAVTGLGVLIRTFDTLTLARSWMRQNAHLYPGLRIDAVERERRRETVLKAEDVGGYLKMAGGRR